MGNLCERSALHSLTHEKELNLAQPQRSPYPMPKQSFTTNTQTLLTTQENHSRPAMDTQEAHRYISSIIYPSSGTHGLPFRFRNIVTVYCPDTKDIFTVRIHNVMTLQEFKLRIAKRFDTYSDNITLQVGEHKIETNQRDD